MDKCIKRRICKSVRVGGVAIGAGAPVSIQTMLNKRTADVEGCVGDILRAKAAGCDLIRLAVPDERSAEAFGEIVRRTGEPLIADIHYSYKLAHLAIDNGAAKIRMNPGNMRDTGRIKALAERMKDNGIPVRVGVNGGSLDPKYGGMPESEALVASALDTADVFESCGFSDIVIAIKASDTLSMIESNRLLAKSCDYPIHLGVTEAGTLRSGLIKSSIGIGTLLQEGIGDTIRVSLSEDIEEEISAGKGILRALGLRGGADIVSCPTCARTEIDVKGLADRIADALKDVRENVRVSVLGCPLNGIGEGKNSDIGIAGGREKSVILLGGEKFETVDNADLMPRFMQLMNEVVLKTAK